MFDYSSKFVAVEIDNLQKTPKGRRVVNAMTASNSEIFKTKRGRLAILLKIDTFKKLAIQLSLVTADSDDGLLGVTNPELTAAVAA